MIFIGEAPEGFNRQMYDGPQIVNVGANHWITVVASRMGGLQVADSLSRRGMHEDAKRVCQQIWPGKDQISLKVQRQFGSNDCGLFALAFAECFCRGVDITQVRFEQTQMRAHFVSCLASLPPKLTPFPLFKS